MTDNLSWSLYHDTDEWRQRIKVADALGMQLCDCGGLIYNLSGGQSVCGDCGKKY